VPETISVPEMISVLEAIPVLEMPSSVFRKAMATKTTPGKPSEMPTTEMTTTTTEMTTAATKASTSSAMAAASSAVSECGGGHNRQNQTGKETVK